MNIINKIKAFLADENGAETIEWVVVTGVVVALAVTVFTGTGGVSSKVTAMFDKIILNLAKF